MSTGSVRGGQKMSALRVIHSIYGGGNPIKAAVKQHEAPETYHPVW